ncbi:uncharacterized protein PG998_005257 [Apiospora kogelbergensis]|uniref:uncharacterized protein n=1 Tax=Apiospora kogelbergensis TaxID=1337665 RepID=UPI00312E561F
MHISSLALGLLAIFVTISAAIPGSTSTAHLNKEYTEEHNGVQYTVFEHANTGAKMSYVNNSGICETTQGVNQYSGYISIGNNMNMFFWFFEARDNPTTAPLAAWFNGGPGCSSMIGLFQENGPCQFYNGSSTPSLNDYSWNTFANMLYIDQPIGVGFSYGDADVNSTVSAAPRGLDLVAILLCTFPTSYGGHYGPEFASYIQQQNAAISAQKIPEEHINLVAVGINNGCANNSYNQILSPSDYSTYMDTYNSKCAPAISDCYNSGTDDSLFFRAEYVLSRYRIRNHQLGRLRRNTTVQNAIGAQSQYQECANDANSKFQETGDNTRSFIATLSDVVQSGITVLVWAGDADWICNYMGVLAVANSVSFNGSDDFNSKDLQPYTVNGKETGRYKTVDNFSYLQVYAAGHEVPYYQPATALQVFIQTMQEKGISST